MSPVEEAQTHAWSLVVEWVGQKHLRSLGGIERSRQQAAEQKAPTLVQVEEEQRQ